MLGASINIGSNSIRLLVAEVGEEVLKPLYYGRVATRLARDINNTRRLSRHAIAATLEALTGFMQQLREYSVKTAWAVGTSALREAQNTRELTDEIMQQTGMEVKVISAREEAALMARGVCASVPGNNKTLIVDIGGGSTEIVYTVDAKITDLLTIPVGVVKLIDQNRLSDPPSPGQITALDAHIRKEFSAAKDTFIDKLDSKTGLVMTAGTATTLACMDRGIDLEDFRDIHLHRLTRAALDLISDSVVTVPKTERESLKGLEPDRADLIIPGVRLTIILMELFDFHEMTISNHGLLEGVLLESVQDRKRP